MLKPSRFAFAFAATLAACAGAAGPSGMEPYPYDEDDPVAARATEPATDATARAPAPAPVRSSAALPPPGATAGEIAQPDLHAVLDAGAGRFLAGIEVDPVFRDQRFVGWQIVRFEPVDSRIARAPLVAGDLVLAVNARSIAKPQQLQSVWDELRTASELVIAGERAGAAFELRYAIRPAQP